MAITVKNCVDCGPCYPACGTSTTAGGEGVTTNYYSMGTSAGTVTITYEMYSIPDKMDVYIGATLVATTGGPVSGAGTLNFSYTPASPYLCRVVVTGPSGTAWDYTIGCPV